RSRWAKPLSTIAAEAKARSSSDSRSSQRVWAGLCNHDMDPTLITGTGSLLAETPRITDPPPGGAGRYASAKARTPGLGASWTDEHRAAHTRPRRTARGRDRRRRQRRQ